MKYPFPKRLEAMPPEFWEARNQTIDDARAGWAERVAYIEGPPHIGETAPDFNLELLSPQGKRTGEYWGLSSLFGTPIGLIFGSYT